MSQETLGESLRPNSQLQRTRLVVPPGADRADETPEHQAQAPAKMIRIGTMIHELLTELCTSTLDEASRERLQGVYQTSVRELDAQLPEDVREEFTRLMGNVPGDGAPTGPEWRIAHAQLIGWLDGLVQGIQAMMATQQAETAARADAKSRAERAAARLESPPQEDERAMEPTSDKRRKTA